MTNISDLEYICRSALWKNFCDTQYVGGKLQVVSCSVCSHLTLCNMVQISIAMLQSDYIY